MESIQLDRLARTTIASFGIKMRELQISTRMKIGVYSRLRLLRPREDAFKSCLSSIFLQMSQKND